MAGKKNKLSRKRSKGPNVRIFKRGLTTFAVICFFLFTLLVASYVIFFRTVLAGEIETKKQNSIIFEEPFAPVPPEVAGIVKKKTESDKGRPKVAIIIDDMGHDRELGYRFLSLEMNLSFSFLPFAPFTQELESISYKDGRAVLLHLPLQPRSKEWDPGPGALYIGDGAQKVRELFERNFDRVPHATGVNNHMGSLYTEDRQAMTTLLGLVKEKELFYIDSFTTSKSIGYLVARKVGIKTARRNVFLDNVLTEEQVCNQLKKLVQLAELQGSAIGIGHPSKVTLLALKGCGKELTSSVDVVDITQLLQ